MVTIDVLQVHGFYVLSIIQINGVTSENKSVKLSLDQMNELRTGLTEIDYCKENKQRVSILVEQ